MADLSEYGGVDRDIDKVREAHPISHGSSFSCCFWLHYCFGNMPGVFFDEFVEEGKDSWVLTVEGGARIF